MFDLKALSAVESQLAERAAGRTQSAEILYARALEILERYRAEGDALLLEQAMQELSKTIQAARSLPEPYMMLAYLYHGLGAYRQSVSYLREAQRLAPDAPFVAQLREMIEQGQAIPVISDEDAAAEPEAEGLDEAAAEALYGRLQQAMDEALREIETPEPDPGADLAAALEQVEYRWLQWRGFISFFQSQLELVQGSHETSRLELALSRIRAKAKALESQLRLLQAFEQLTLKLDETQRLLPYYQRIWNPDQAERPPELESLYDLCDEAANQLDQYETQSGAPIYEGLITHYRRLIKQVEDLQDWIDEAQT